MDLQFYHCVLELSSLISLAYFLVASGLHSFDPLLTHTLLRYDSHNISVLDVSPFVASNLARRHPDTRLQSAEKRLIW